MSIRGLEALLAGARLHPDRIAIEADGAGHRYGDLLAAAERVATHLLGPASDLAEARIAYLAPPSFEHVAVQWGIWLAGGMAVPIATTHPQAEIARLVDDAEPAIVVAAPEVLEALRPILREREAFLISTTTLLAEPATRARLLPVEDGRRALMVYTSGTTGRPKGVVTTFANLDAQSGVLADAWGWRPADRILHVLPLHHVHGIVNALACPLRVGATVEFMTFDAERVWERFASGEVSVFMAVPTVYVRLLQAWEDADPVCRDRWSEGAATLRLMVSGSAALPEPVFERWRTVTGQVLLERYGMTEVGMALSNPLAGERVAGSVGAPLPGVEARIVDSQGGICPGGESGELELRGPQIFREYWRRPDETRAAFRDDWFRTGDEAVVEDRRWRIRGRRSVDILKTGGYKVSALEIERQILEHPAVAEVAVVGVPDAEWGDRVCAAVVLKPGAVLEPSALRSWCRERLAPYKIPRTVRVIDALPRNALGKVTKPDLVAQFGVW